jgi:hypothetical protein
MSEHGYPPAGDGSSEPPAPPFSSPPYQSTPAYQPPPPYQAPPPYEPPQPYQPAPYQPDPYQPDPYQSTSSEPASYQPAPYEPAPYQPTSVDQPATPYQPGVAYQPNTPYLPGQSDPSGPNNPGAFAGYPPPNYPGYQATSMPGPWQPGQPPKRRRTGLIIGSIVAVVVVLCGGGIVAVLVNHKTSSTATSSTTSTSTKTGKPAPTVVAIAPGDGAALKAHLAKMPAGAKKSSVDGSTSGIETLDQYMKLHFSKDPAERGILEERGFKVAAENYWIDKHSVQVNTQLMQFGDSSGAEGQLIGQKGAFADDPAATAHYTLPGLVHGTGLEESGLDKYGNRTAILMCQDGPIYIVIFIYTPGKFNRPSELAIIKRQVDALKP